MNTHSSTGLADTATLAAAAIFVQQLIAAVLLVVDPVITSLDPTSGVVHACCLQRAAACATNESEVAEEKKLRGPVRIAPLTLGIPTGEISFEMSIPLAVEIFLGGSKGKQRTSANYMTAMSFKEAASQLCEVRDPMSSAVSALFYPSRLTATGCLNMGPYVFQANFLQRSSILT